MFANTIPSTVVHSFATSRRSNMGKISIFLGEYLRKFEALGTKLDVVLSRRGFFQEPADLPKNGFSIY